MPPYQYHWNSSARCITIFVSMHHWIFLDLCSHFVCDVARHLSPTTGSYSSNNGRSFANETFATSLFRWLCPSPQRPLYWHFNLSFDDNITHSILRLNFTARIRNGGCHRSHHLWIDSVRNGNACNANWHVSNTTFAIWCVKTLHFGWHSLGCRYISTLNEA